jgi:hypothetical protein
MCYFEKFYRGHFCKAVTFSTGLFLTILAFNVKNLPLVTSYSKNSYTVKDKLRYLFRPIFKETFNFA